VACLVRQSLSGQAPLYLADDCCFVLDSTWHSLTSKGGKVTSAGWQVTLCDLIWHVISRSGVVILIMNCYIRFTYLLTYLLTLWSADVPTSVVLQTLSSYGDRTFAVTGPHLWNSLVVELHNPDITYRLFRRQLKGYLFLGSMNTALCDF